MTSCQEKTYRESPQTYLIVAEGIVHGQEALGLPDVVVREPLVQQGGSEPVALDFLFRLNELGVDVGRKFARAHVPEQFFGGHVGLCGLVVEFDMAAQLPQVLVIEPGTVGCDVQVDLELVVIAFDEDAFGELPSGRVGLVEHPPFLSNDLVAYDTRIGYELAHAVRHHDWQRIATLHGSSHRRCLAVATRSQ